MRNLKSVLTLLSDGKRYSGEIIAKKLKMTRAGVWKIIQYANTVGIKINGITRIGYQITHPISFLSPVKIKEHLSKDQKKNIKIIEVFDEIDSTNSYLLQRIYEFSKIPRICLAEQQTDGRGRRGRIWHSPFAQNIYLSLLWKFSLARSDLNGLSLVIAIAIAEVLEKLKMPKKIKIKWPNDIFIDEKKCAGILIETRGEMHDGAQVVIGIGINVNMQASTEKEISQKWTSLSRELNHAIDRNELAAHVIDKVIADIERFDAKGFLPFQFLFEKYDMTFSQEIQIQFDNKSIKGKACGIDQQGRLILMTKEGRMHISIGDVSMQA
ncbi:MAG TPA: biotin--[acetyl-CoA-carboxylase] ligase [Coxiellaceae bacterium]|nr:biotin--[acetyl-CoA-carboxylase] ligase [Coxiellaceae bacterium]